jgi:NitT/TauT family transport system ATP-binding protein
VGKTTAIIGPSGCGKSTLLRLMAGLIKPTGGDLVTRFDTTSRRTSGPDTRHPVTVVFQEDTLLPWLTVRKNVALYFRLHRHVFPPAQVRAHITRLLEMVGLEAFADAYPKQLSGGMKRRIAFLAAVAPNPRLLLLDEPFSSVDEPTRVQIHQQVRRIIQESETTTVLVTHDLAEAISLADRVVILSQRPTHVATVHDITFNRDMDLLAVRDTPGFLEMYGKLWHALSLEIRGGKDQAVEQEGPIR